MRYWSRVNFEFTKKLCEYAWTREEELKDGRAAAVRAARERLFDAHSHITDVLRHDFLEGMPFPSHAHSYTGVDTTDNGCYPSDMNDTKRRWVVLGVSDELRQAVTLWAAVKDKTIAEVLEEELAPLIDHTRGLREQMRETAIAMTSNGS